MGRRRTRNGSELEPTPRCSGARWRGVDPEHTFDMLLAFYDRNGTQWGWRNFLRFASTLSDEDRRCRALDQARKKLQQPDLQPADSKVIIDLLTAIVRSPDRAEQLMGHFSPGPSGLENGATDANSRWPRRSWRTPPPRHGLPRSARRGRRRIARERASTPLFPFASRGWSGGPG